MPQTPVDIPGFKFMPGEEEKHTTTLRRQRALKKKEAPPKGSFDIVEEIPNAIMTSAQASERLRDAGYTDKDIERLIREQKLIPYKSKNHENEVLFLTSAIQYLETLKEIEVTDEEMKKEAA